MKKYSEDQKKTETNDTDSWKYGIWNPAMTKYQKGSVATNSQQVGSKSLEKQKSGERRRGEAIHAIYFDPRVHFHASQSHRYWSLLEVFSKIIQLSLLLWLADIWREKRQLVFRSCHWFRIVTCNGNQFIHELTNQLVIPFVSSISITQFILFSVRNPLPHYAGCHNSPNYVWWENANMNQNRKLEHFPS